MKTFRELRTFLSALLMTMPLAAQTGATHGTINILIGNRNGAVLVTDSRATAKNGQYSDRAQKLFRIDDKTVCSIANFGSDPSPYSETNLSSGGIVEDFSDALQRYSGQLNFTEKANGLANFMGLYLARLGMVYAASKHASESSSREIQSLVAGFDLDGSLKMARISVEADALDKQPSKISVEVSAVGNEVTFLTAGYDYSTKTHLKYPKTFEDPQMRVYTRALEEHHTDALTLTDLQDLAEFLEHDAALTSRVIGGPLQTAYLQNGEVVVKHIPTLQIPPRPMLADIVANVGVGRGSEIVPGIYSTPLDIRGDRFQVNYHCSHSGMTLDGLTMYEGSYDHCTFFFDGGFFKRDKTAQVFGGTVVLGPHVAADSGQIERFRSEFPESEVISYREAKIPKTWVDALWPPAVQY